MEDAQYYSGANTVIFMVVDALYSGANTVFMVVHEAYISQIGLLLASVRYNNMCLECFLH